MLLFLTILEGTTPDDARPIMAIRDVQILAKVREMVQARLVETALAPVVPMPRRRGSRVRATDTQSKLREVLRGSD
jgi:hypothetical protein